MINTSKYITVIPFSGLFNWSVQYLNETKISFNTKYPLVRIGEFLKRNKTAIDIQDDLIYKRVTIKVRNGGVVQRDTEIGRNIGTKRQFIVHEGQFILSKIDARNGAMGIIPAELEGAVVTQDFLPYDLDRERINSQYLVLVSTTKEFVDFCQTCSSGTTNRQRIDEAKFLDIKIPLPSIEEQNKLVDAYNYQMDLAIVQEDISNTLQTGIKTYITDKLGISNQGDKSIEKGLHFVNFSHLSKWGLEHIYERNKSESNYPIFKISDMCKISSGGTPSRNNSKFYGGDIPWIKTGELQNNVLFDTEEKITEFGMQNSSAKLYPVGSLVIAMYGATIGKTAKLGVESTTNQACAVLFEIDNSVICTDYLWEYIQSQTENLKALAYGSAQPNLNAGIIANYILPIPPMKIQNEIVEHIHGLKAEIITFRTQAAENRAQAITDFEQKIFQ
ncbi:restriction endonuclease subunit S [Bacteroides sedimenti]|uniref:Type I restriction modification DNA specificity domain-containing protein n=1 Tax=Bacteroides sedimenti TaxID=2136147 RepID=A0ABM8IB27_9BACE